MLKITQEGDTIRARIGGEIDHHHAREIRAQLDAALNERMPKRLVLDLSEVSFMDSSGVGLIMGRYRLMKEMDGTVTVENVPPRIEKMLRLSGIGQLARISGKEKTE